MPWIDEPISSDFLRTSRQLDLKIKSKINNKSKIFLSIEKNITCKYNLICKANFHEEASAIAAYLPSYFYKNYGQKVLTLFDLYY